jgi:DNA repair exonuclease SbcCD ATPase subunit
MPQRPFDNIDSAHDYVRLLAEQIHDVETEIAEDIAEAAGSGFTRRVDALQLVSHKLKQLKQHLAASSRVLNDLRALRRLLIGQERDGSQNP